jgi:penicillin-binding protein 2
MGQKSHNAWTVAFAPHQAPRYAVVVVVQGGKSGGAVAGPLVHLILRGIFAQEGGLKLPLEPLATYEGHFEPITQITLPDGDLLPLAIDEQGETGEEAVEAEPSVAPAIMVRPRAIPLPSITPEADPVSPTEKRRRRSPVRRR